MARAHMAEVEDDILVQVADRGVGDHMRLVLGCKGRHAMGQVHWDVFEPLLTEAWLAGQQ
jgi:hypothetical protein